MRLDYRKEKFQKVSVCGILCDFIVEININHLITSDLSNYINIQRHKSNHKTITFTHHNARAKIARAGGYSARVIEGVLSKRRKENETE
mgnify:CR=1 FL=1